MFNPTRSRVQSQKKVTGRPSLLDDPSCSSRRAISHAKGDRRVFNQSSRDSLAIKLPIFQFHFTLCSQRPNRFHGAPENEKILRPAILTMLLLCVMRLEDVLSHHFLQSTRLKGDIIFAYLLSGWAPLGS